MIVFNGDGKAIRNLAIAINTVREGRIVKERETLQWLDSDSQLVAIIYQQLQDMQEPGALDEAAEALPLVPASQPKPSKMLSAIHGMLEQIPMPEELETEISKSRKAS